MKRKISTKAQSYWRYESLCIQKKILTKHKSISFICIVTNESIAHPHRAPYQQHERKERKYWNANKSDFQDFKQKSKSPYQSYENIKRLLMYSSCFCMALTIVKIPPYLCIKRKTSRFFSIYKSYPQTFIFLFTNYSIFWCYLYLYMYFKGVFVL